MNVLLQQGVTAQAEARPEATALVLGETRVTYGELEEASNRLARLLADAGCRHGDRVGLLMPKMPAAVLGMLGTLKAGATYVPLDPAGPELRLARMLEASDPRFILAAGPVERMLRDSLAAARLERPPSIGWLDPGLAMTPGLAPAPAFTLQDLAGYPATAPRTLGVDSDIAHILFTSGSTGTPKGVMITHASVAHFLRWANRYFGITALDRNSQHPPLHFDLSTFDIYGTLWAGAELHLVPAELSLLPHKLAQFIRDSRLTQWFSVPAVLNAMAKFDVVRQEDFATLRRLLFAGEAIPTPTLIYWMRRLPHVQFTNLYGPTETTISSSYYTVPRCPADEREPVPIGTACDGEELLVLDATLRPLPQGETGEIYIGGVGLSPGYWRDAARTAAAFLPRPGGGDAAVRIYKTGDLGRVRPDGAVQFLGRADSQIKSRGYRIELGEIEAALHSLPGLRESAVVAVPSDGFEGWQICCAYAPAPDSALTARGLREALTALLPAYMLPTRWLRYGRLPKNANGKIDRPRLKLAFVKAEAHPARAHA